MDTTTQDAGAQAQPNEGAVSSQEDMVVTTDNMGTPTLVPVSQVEAAPSTEATSEPAVEETKVSQDTKEPTQAVDITQWAKSKGLEINPENPTEVKLATMQREAEQKMHQATEQAKKVVPLPELLEDVADPTINRIVERQNELELKQYVTNWFNANPELSQYREDLARISAERPYLHDMEDVAAHLYREPKFIERLQNEGGKKALTNLAQKQSNIPPASAATNSSEFSTGNITPQNVDQMVANMSVDEYKKRLPEINKALAG